MADRDQLAFADHCYPSAQPLRFLHVVCGEEDRYPFLGGEGGQVLPHCGCRHDIEAGSRFIQEDQGRAVKHGAGQGQLLLHALTPFAGLFFASIPHTHVSEELLYAGTAIGGWDSPDSAVELEVVLGAQLFIDARVLEQCAGAGPDFIRLGPGIEAQHLGPAVGRL